MGDLWKELISNYFTITKEQALITRAIFIFLTYQNMVATHPFFLQQSWEIDDSA